LSTDGSKLESIVLAALCIPCIQFEILFYRIANEPSIYSNELATITKEITWIIENYYQSTEKFFIFTDTLSVAIYPL
jgi:hypothetical protein